MTGKIRIGVDLGGTKIAAAAVDEDFRILARLQVPTGKPENLVRTISALVRDTAEKAGVSLADTASAGIGIPGTVDRETGTVVYANNLGLVNVKLPGMIEEELGIRVDAENDAQSAAIGEYLCGAGRGCRSLVMVTVGTGIGGGIILNGKVYHGTNGAAGEFGHMTIHKGGRRCSCGRRGCFEMYASTTALLHDAERQIRKHPDTILKKEALSGKNVLDAVRSGDAAAEEAYASFLQDLETGIVSLVNVFEPDRLLIGGGISAAGEILIRPLRETVERECYARFGSRKTQVMAAALGNDAGLVGAAYCGEF